MKRLGILSLDHPHSTGNHIPALKYMKDRFPVTAICHPDREAAAPWLELFGAAYYADRDAFLADPNIDAVLITSTNDRHAEDCIAAVKAGKAVFCDKPIAVCVEDGVRIAKAVEEYKVPFLTTFPVRFSDTVLRTKALIDAGKLGKIQAVCATNHGCMYEPGAPDWVRDPVRNGGGCIIDHTVHVADIIRWFTGEEFDTVSTYAKRALHNNINAEDIAVMQGSMTGGTVFQIDASWSRRPGDPMWGDVTIRVAGEKGAAYLDLYNNQRMEVYVSGDLKMQYPNLVAREHGDIFDDYLCHTEQGAPLVGAGVLDGLRTIELAYAAYDAFREGHTVRVRRHLEQQDAG